MRTKSLLALSGLIAVLATPVAAKDERCNEDATACLRYIVENFENKGWMGVELAYPEGRTSAKITRVVPDSPAEAAGLRAGDLLVAFDGARYEDSVERAQAAAKKALVPGNEFDLTIARDGQEQVLKVTAGKVPSSVLAQWVGEHMLYQHRHQIADADPE